MAEPLPFHLEYITDEDGAHKAVVLQIQEFEELLEDLHDLAVVAERCLDGTVPASAHAQLTSGGCS